MKHLDVLKRNDFRDFEKPRKNRLLKGKIEPKDQSKNKGQPK